MKKTIKFDNFESINTILEKQNVVVLFYGEPKENAFEYELFFNMTEKFQHLHFYYFSNHSIIEQLNMTEIINPPSVIIMKNYDEELKIYIGKFSFEDIFSFIKIYTRPVLSTLNGDSYLYIINERISFIAMLIQANHSKLEEFKEIYYDNSFKYRNIIMSFIGDLDDQKSTTLTYEFNIKNADLPVMLIEEFTPEKTIKRYKSVAGDFENNVTISEFFDKFFTSK